MMKKIVIFALCLCLLTACSDSSGTAGDSSNTDSLTVSDTTTTTESTTISTTTSFSEETTAAKPADAELWNDVKYVIIDGLYLPIPNGYKLSSGSGEQNKNYTKYYHGELKIKCLQQLCNIDEVLLTSESEKIDFSTKNLKKELYSKNNLVLGIIYFEASEGSETWKEARIFVNGSSSTFLVTLSGQFDYNDYKKYCDLVEYDPTTKNTTTSTTTTTTTSEPETTLSLEYQNAVKSAKSWLEFDAYSRSGLIKRLEADKFPTAAATYAADNCGADWNEQAVKSAQSWLEFDHYSKQGLIDRLIADGFTQSEAQHGADVAYK